MIQRLILLIYIILFSIILACSDNNPANSNPDPDPIHEIPSILYSPYIGDSLRIYIGLPSDYDPDRNEEYHTVYLLDGDWYFDGSHYRLGDGGVRGMLNRMNLDGTAPEAILIGIGYEGTGTNQRGRDFLFSFQHFYLFILNELMPLVDSELNAGANGGRTIMGHSDGGFCVMRFFGNYGVYPENTFQNYIALSGDYTKIDSVVFDLERSLSLRLGINGSFPVNLFMGVGGQEELRFTSSNSSLTDSIESRNYQNFRFQSIVYPNLGHNTVEDGFSDGLNWVFQ
jgi:predicted alpha/beta superfamily hydrolase